MAGRRLPVVAARATIPEDLLCPVMSGRSLQGCNLTTNGSAVTNQLDLFEDGRDVMLRNDVLTALEQRNADAGREALQRLAAEYPDDALVPTLETLVCVLEGPVHEHFATHTALRDTCEAWCSPWVPAARRAFGDAAGMAWCLPLWRAVARAASQLPFRREIPNGMRRRYGCAQRSGLRHVKASGESGHGDEFQSRSPGWPRRSTGSRGLTRRGRFWPSLLGCCRGSSARSCKRSVIRHCWRCAGGLMRISTVTAQPMILPGFPLGQ